MNMNNFSLFTQNTWHIYSSMSEYDCFTDKTTLDTIEGNARLRLNSGHEIFIHLITAVK